MDKTQNPNNNEMVIDLVQLARALWRRAWAIVLAMVIFGGAAFGYARFLITPLYQASAMMYVNNSSINVGSTQVDLSDLSAAQSLVETYIVILKTRGTLEQVIEQENLSYDYETLSDMIEAGAVNSTEVFEIQVTSADPEEAERIANCIAELLPGELSSVYFVNSGAEAIEGALKLAKRYTHRTELVSMRRAYHGSTHGAMTMMGAPFDFSESELDLSRPAPTLGQHTEEVLRDWLGGEPDRKE